jgi:hypothetical protein
MNNNLGQYSRTPFSRHPIGREARLSRLNK